MEQTVMAKRKEITAGVTESRVANEILDNCERSFVAAQESTAKTSTSFYDDTALMALLCRHDRVLFIANMNSRGEKQHYALALLQALFSELPLHWNVGVLYDVGCQLDRSCAKVCHSFNWYLVTQLILARVTGRVLSSNHLGFVGLPCLWPPVAMSACLSPQKAIRFWIY